MRRCLTCSGLFDEERLVCPADGDLLLAEGRPAAETGTLLDGLYLLGNLLGEGGMGRVFAATRSASGEEVAVKLLKGGSTGEAGEERRVAERRFQVEAQAASALDDPGVAKVLEFKRTGEGVSYIVMERLRGATLGELRRAGKLESAERVVELIRQVARVLSLAHQRGIVHRDLKPSNIFLHRPDRERSVVKVLDFGIAKILDAGGERLTSTGEFLGTLLYMAPELIAGRPVTRACDIYSLGVILFEALAGQVPFPAQSPLELLRLHSSRPAPALQSFRPEVSDELEAVVARCLLRSGEHRFPDAGGLSEALEGLSAVGAPGRPPPKTRVFQGNPSLWVGVVLEDRYEIQEWIAPGRFGSDVYRALHLRAGVSVAVRLWRTGSGPLRDHLLRAFQREARAMGVRHPNLVAILDLGFNDDAVYLVTELVESISLRALLERRGTLPPATALDLVRGAAEGLGALHRSGIVSGGLSPETLRVAGGRDGPLRLLLTPFGLQGLEQLRSLLPEREPGAAGDRSADYIAPEEREGRSADERSDLYSLALILRELVGGPRDPEGKWARFFERSLAHDPAKRFASAAEFSGALPEAGGPL